MTRSPDHSATVERLYHAALARPAGVYQVLASIGALVTPQHLELGEPEVEHFDDALGRDLDVGGFQVAMDDASLMRRIKGVCDLPCDVERLGQRQPVWSRDGASTYFAGDDDRVGNVWQLSLRNHTERPVTNLIGRRGTLGVMPPSSDGKNLYFPWRDDRGDIWVMDVAP